MHTSEKIVTPDLAEKFLASMSPDNRKETPSNTRFFSRLIQSGQFKLTHQGLAIDEDGRLIDGQHRCRAVLATGLSITVMITYGVNASAYTAMDAGRKRSASDCFPKDWKNVAELAAASRMLIAFQSGTTKLSANAGTFSNDDVVDFVATNPRLHDCVARSRSPYVGVGVTKSLVAAFRFIITEVDYSAGHAFADAIQEEGLAPIGTAACVFRKLIQGRDRPSSKDMGTFMLKAWERHREGGHVSRLTIGKFDGHTVAN